MVAPTEGPDRADDRAGDDGRAIDGRVLILGTDLIDVGYETVFFHMCFGKNESSATLEIVTCLRHVLLCRSSSTPLVPVTRARVREGLPGHSERPSRASTKGATYMKNLSLRRRAQGRVHL